MAPLGNEIEKAETSSGVFATTHWSVVLSAGQSESPQAVQALETLCGAYWYPLYAYGLKVNMATPSTCLNCGTPLAGDARQEFCPKCLFLQAGAGLLDPGPAPDENPLAEKSSPQVAPSSSSHPYPESRSPLITDHGSPITDHLSHLTPHSPLP